MVASIANNRDRELASSKVLRVTWFDGWDPSLNEALQTLPEMDCCPHELYRTLLQTPGPVQKRAALVTDHGIPVAIVGLRRKGRLSWEPLTQWIIPGAIFPAQPEYIIPAIEALGTEVWVAWWRMKFPPPESRWAQSIKRTPTYRLHLTPDYEEYWRVNNHFKNIRKARNRCRNFICDVNAPGAAEWTIKKWESRWRIHPDSVDPALCERMVSAKYLERQGRHFTIRLLDHNTPVGGATLFSHDDDLVAGVIYREPEYDWYGIGARLIDLTFSFAAEHGYQVFDIGGGQDYKRHWAPVEGEHWLFNICPGYLYQIKQTIDWARKLRGNISNWVRGDQERT